MPKDDLVLLALGDEQILRLFDRALTSAAYKVAVAGDKAAPSATPVPRSHARNSDPPRPCLCRSATTRGSELHVPATSVPEIETLTGVSGDAAINVGPSRTTQ